ncbi:cellulose biosynthesis protein BcsG [Legionella fallonii]|uniref:Putative endoglucanase involved in cellulose biosynthesis (BcsG) n=1 Tax=Legionella fallonii LLAP-10 TaxID=1212491 RepID=A0A098G9M4_9GAMM|nr:cellulose biosynthesis protein BcsG [Legionella fallonii]CEG58687.1 putative endoglucanase involved in cellulose biosynthesis (bcsG) [Legionella fallonii LLAP-10]
MINTEQLSQETSSAWRNWRGLGAWNYYFILKFALLWYGYLNFHPFLNLIFLAVLLFPLPSLFLHRCRNWLALPIGLGLFYHDTWLPNIYSIMDQGANIFKFSPDYILELINRFINWQMVGAAFVLLVAYLFLSQWIRITVFTVVLLCWLNILTIQGPAISLLPMANKTTANPSQTTATTGQPSAAVTTSTTNMPPTNENLNAYLNQFYNTEKPRKTNFPDKLAADAQAFDLLIIHICSLAWADLDAVHLRNHPLWSQFDIFFNKFNSAASYSGPAGIRLLRASCGQTSHTALYDPVNQDCYLLENLAKLGFTTEVMLDHNGVFGNFLKELQDDGDIAKVPLMSHVGINQSMIEFDGSPLFSNDELLNKWLKERPANNGKPTATYYNIITLHDGNRSLADSKVIPYEARAKKLFDQLVDFFTILEKSGRKVVIVVIPEHGANLTGDKLQMPGLRDIPSPAITQIPVGIKLIGAKALNKGEAVQINNPSSYLAISELISRLADGKLFNSPQLDLKALTNKLPQTAEVSENEGVIVIDYQGKPYVLLKGDSNWAPYPQP